MKGGEFKSTKKTWQAIAAKLKEVPTTSSMKILKARKKMMNKIKVVARGSKEKVQQVILT